MTVHRPTTRGELRECLRRGVACEVVTYRVEMESIILRGWGKFSAFSVSPSENEGWSVFTPTASAQQEAPSCPSPKDS